MSTAPQGPPSEPRTPYSRSRHRSANHHSAHADEAASHPEPPAHALIPRGVVPLIQTDADLAELIAHLKASGSFAYDSEFIGELSYVPKLCLIQVATTTCVALIDPLADLDLNPFWHLLADPSVEKVVHAGEQDVEPVVRFIGKTPTNLFDTQIAAGFISMPYPVALSKLVLEMTGARLGKGLTFTHWDQRPLSAQQLRYAADDVRYLPAIRAEMGEKLNALGHFDWAREESDSICKSGLYQFDPETQYLRVRGSGSLQPKQLAILKELTIWRDAGAREADSPPRAFLKDEILVDLARNTPRSVDKLARVRGLPRPVEERHGHAIIDAITRGMAVPQEQWPTVKDNEQTPADRFRCDSLWALVQCIASSQSIDANLVSSRQEITEVYRFITGKQTERPHLLTGWRDEAVGQVIVGMINNQAKVQLIWKDGWLQQIKD